MGSISINHLVYKKFLRSLILEILKAVAEFHLINPQCPSGLTIEEIVRAVKLFEAEARTHY